MNYTLITGATGCLGRAFAEECRRRGENLFLTGRDEGKLSALKSALLSDGGGGDVVCRACDLSDGASRGELFAAAEGYVFSRLINVAGADIQKPFCDYDERKLTFQVRANFEGAASMCLFCLGHRADELSIINISSLCGEYDMPYFAIYAAAKGALTSLSVALAGEFGGKGVKVTAVLPGSVYTRPDIADYIRSQGVFAKMSAKSPQYIVKKSLAASERGAVKYVPGGLNKLFYFASKLVPRPIMVRLNARMRAKTYKDVF